ncbi:seipin isoform X1 [Pararge aegeria]|uniref:Seipin n=1 Tax=Pararge aegeria aegeria TaxID=348720 RepID=A0A8S4RXN9_9NEOP|nr:seipin isoform X1 [Pararge aegeria]CAH2242553.1 jg8125 [Pararge aegeria aegeria]
MAIIAYMNPFNVFRDFIRLPIEAFVSEQYTGYKKKTNEGLTSVKELLYRAAIVLVFLSAILWISIFLYVIFYYTYMPNVTHVRPVHLQFKSCDENMGVCSFPSAHVQLTKSSQMLMSSQPYRIKLILEVPESQINKDIGMFMVCAQMRAPGGVLVSSSCRSAMLRHRSKLHQVIRTLFYAPLLVSGFNEEKQFIQVELFSDFEDDQARPVTDAYVELQSRFVQVFSSELHIEAHFTGLRYAMYYWPKISAIIGICSNLFVVSLIFILSWYHLQDGFPEFLKTKLGIEVKTEKGADSTKMISKMKLEREDSFPFIEEESLLEEFQRLEKKT